ncbi:MAG: hypothetical protein AAGF84_10785 [Planctomycetota bacterium]
MAAAVTEDYKAFDMNLGDTGVTGRRAFDVEARSILEAVNVLDRVASIHRGAVFEDWHGNRTSPLAYCTNLRPKAKTPIPLNGTGLVRIECEFRSQTFGGTTEEPEIDGTPRYAWRGLQRRTKADVDRNGNRITNSLGQTLKVPYDEAYAVLEVVWRTTIAPSAEKIILTNESINSANYRGIPAGQGYCPSLTSDPIIVGDTEIGHEQRARFVAHRTARNPRPIDAGLQEIVVPNDSDQPLLGADGVVGNTRPSLTPLGAGSGKFLGPGDAVNLRPQVDLYTPVNWATLWGI